MIKAQEAIQYTTTNNENLCLEYDIAQWKEVPAKISNTLQFFITNRCNLRCKGCFYQHGLGKEEMKLDMYKLHVLNHLDDIDKITLMGGEPTLYEELPRMIQFNDSCRLKTTIYTNGANLKILEDIGQEGLKQTQIRIGVYGAFESEKPLANIRRTRLPITIVYMLRKDNIHELMATAKMAETEFNCKKFLISTIRDINTTQDYWKDTDETINMYEYFDIIQDFVDNYTGDMDLHISRRAIIKTKNESTQTFVKKCRFGNIFPDNSKLICPLDISKKIYSKDLTWNKRECNKHSNCILQKLVLKKR